MSVDPAVDEHARNAARVRRNRAELLEAFDAGVRLLDDLHSMAVLRLPDVHERQKVLRPILRAAEELRLVRDFAADQFDEEERGLGS